MLVRIAKMLRREWSVRLLRGEPDKLWKMATELLPKWVRDTSSSGSKTVQEVLSQVSVKSVPRENSLTSAKIGGRREKE